MGRIIALDVGRKRIGLAISDELGWTAQGLETLERTNLKSDLAAVAALAHEREAVLFLIGKPMHMSGQDSRQAEYTRGFGDRLQAATNLPVIYWDERWTSKQAERVLREGGVRTRENAGAVDRLSAAILLDSFLQSPACEEFRKQHSS